VRASTGCSSLNEKQKKQKRGELKTKTEKFEGTLTVLTPLHHGGDEKTGAVTMLRRIIYIVDGEPMEVPYVEGNAVRGMLRRLIMQDLLDRVGFKPSKPRLYHTLFSGGVLEEVELQESGRLDLKLRRDVRTWIPPLSLWGGSIGNQAFAGKMNVGKALPICRELNAYLPQQSLVSFYNYLTFTFFTRRAEREMEIAEEEKPPEPQPSDRFKKEEPTVQMKVEVEVFAPGTRLYHWFTLLDATPLEQSCFAHALDLWRDRPFLGGKSSSGYGEIRIDYNIPYKAETYLAWLEENKGDVVKTLEALDKL